MLERVLRESARKPEGAIRDVLAQSWVFGGAEWSADARESTTVSAAGLKAEDLFHHVSRKWVLRQRHERERTADLHYVSPAVITEGSQGVITTLPPSCIVGSNYYATAQLHPSADGKICWVLDSDGELWCATKDGDEMVGRGYSQRASVHPSADGRTCLVDGKMHDAPATMC